MGFFEKANVGDIVTFGTYEQDNNTYNGNEEIERIVLAKEDDKALVISRYILDLHQYNPESVDITWEECGLRKWLSEPF